MRLTLHTSISQGRALNSAGIVKSLEAELMDWADDITYAVHDVVDFYCAGRIPLDILGNGVDTELSRFYEEVFGRKGNEKLEAERDAHQNEFEVVCQSASELPFKGFGTRALLSKRAGSGR